MNVMIIRPAGIGDGVLCLPVATAIRRAFPDSRVTMLSSGHAAPLFDHHPDVHQVKTVDGKERLRELIDLFRAAVDAVVFLMPYRRLKARENVEASFQPTAAPMLATKSVDETRRLAATSARR